MNDKKNLVVTEIITHFEKTLTCKVKKKNFPAIHNPRQTLFSV